MSKAKTFFKLAHSTFELSVHYLEQNPTQEAANCSYRLLRNIRWACSKKPMGKRMAEACRQVEGIACLQGEMRVDLALVGRVQMLTEH